jgi:glycolate oxidase FAD binding subunit
MSIATLEPTSAQEVAALLAEAAADRRVLMPCGGGTKLAWQVDPAGASAFVSTRRLDATIVHDAGDLVATLPAGVTLADANRALSKAGQWLPLDPAHAERATIGGITATNDSGPRRFRHGAPRDLILGVEAAFADGRVARAGGRVVKNVAGYDLSRLLCGSFGQLAVITSVTFKLAPLASSSRTLVAGFPNGAAAIAAACDLAHAPVTPSAIEINAPSPRLLVRFESTARAIAQMVDDTAARLREAGATIETLDGDDEAALWHRHDDLRASTEGTLLKISMLPTECADVLTALESSAAPWTLVGRAALGVLFVRVGGDETTRRSVVDVLDHVVARRGHLTILEGLTDSALHLGRFGDALPLMHAVKQQFDPHGVLPTHGVLPAHPDLSDIGRNP